MTASPVITCTVCGEPAEAPATAACGVCDQPFHLNPRNDVDGKDCGEVWIDEQYLSLRFACFTCLRGEAAAGGPHEPPVAEGH